MPIVTIQLTREGSSPGADLVTAEEKARLIKGVSELLRDALGKPTKASFVVIDEVPLGLGAACRSSSIVRNDAQPADRPAWPSPARG